MGFGFYAIQVIGLRVKGNLGVIGIVENEPENTVQWIGVRV